MSPHPILCRLVRRLRWIRWAFPSALLGGAALAAHLGWARNPKHRARPWQEATGWRALDAPPEPTGTIFVGADPEPLRLDWLGHSGFSIEWHGTRLLLDPNLSMRCTVSPRLLERPFGVSDLDAVDGVLISHVHRDHLDLPTLEALGGHGGLPLLALPAGSEVDAASLRRFGTRIVGVAEGEPIAIGALEAVPVPALHGGARSHPLASGQHAAGWIVRHGDAALYYAGDTGYSRPIFRSIGAAHRPAVAILPIGAYAPAWPIGRVHVNPEQAVRAALDLTEGAEGGDPLGNRAPPLVVPCHFGTFVLSLDRADAALPRFARAARGAGLDWRMPRLLGTADGRR